MQYSLLIQAFEPTEEEIPEEAMEPVKVAFDLYAKELDAAGVLVSADILARSDVTTTITMRGGTLKVHDGPFANTREQLGGTFVVDVPDLDAAMAWAQKCPAAQYGSIEIRPSAITFTGGQWVYA